jgi:hypothetical protein
MNVSGRPTSLDIPEHSTFMLIELFGTPKDRSYKMSGTVKGCTMPNDQERLGIFELGRNNAI